MSENEIGSTGDTEIIPDAPDKGSVTVDDRSQATRVSRGDGVDPATEQLSDPSTAPTSDTPESASDTDTSATGSDQTGPGPAASAAAQAGTPGPTARPRPRGPRLVPGAAVAGGYTRSCTWARAAPAAPTTTAASSPTRRIKGDDIARTGPLWLGSVPYAKTSVAANSRC